MNKIGTTDSGYKVIALMPGEDSPMLNHGGGDIAVDNEMRIMYVVGVCAAMYGTDSIMRACNSYKPA